MLDILISVLFGLVEGITEWLPISSTGHMILLEEFISFRNVSEGFFDMFDVVIQLGAIMSVVVLYWTQIMPIKIKKEHAIKVEWDNNIFTMWLKILVACVPAAIIGILFDDVLDKYLYNGYVVAIMLILFGIAFIIVENWNKGKNAKINSLTELGYNTAALIGIFQVLAAVFPGTSRSGSTIVGALLIGVSRTVAAEFTFFLAIPVMFGASLLKILDFGLDFTSLELAVLATGMIVAFVVSMLVIKFLMGYIKKHDFKVFGWYRIVLGAVVLLYFALAR